MPKRKNSSLSSGAPHKRGKVDSNVKWSTLSHSGPRFQSPYKRIPGAKLIYEGKLIALSKPAEEAAVFYANYLRRRGKQSNKSERTLKSNFFEDWTKIMTPKERKIIKDFKKCNFNKVVKSIDKYKVTQNKKKRSKTEKERLKKHRTVIVDGKREQVSNPVIEPPGIYFGRGENPNIGKIKARIRPEDVTLNCDKRCKPKAPKGHRWKKIIHDNSVSWLACWKDSITNNMKYIDLHSSSTLKSKNEGNKYGKVDQLRENIGNVRRKYSYDLKSSDEATAQRATAVYLIDTFALRAGNEKGANATDTVGCCSLRCEHLTLLPNSKIRLDFDGKDSVPYRKTLQFSKQVYSNIRGFMKRKPKAALVFDQINTQTVNQYLSSIMAGLTAKVFRTYTASTVYENELRELLRKVRKTEIPKIERNRVAMLTLLSKRANLAAAKILNHQNIANSKDKTNGVERMRERIKKIKRQRDEVNKKLKMKSHITGTKRIRLQAKRQELTEKLQLEQKNREFQTELGSYALNTSKINYIDPRITIGWCLDNDLPFNKLYSKANLPKVEWAIQEVRKNRRRGIRRRI